MLLEIGLALLSLNALSKSRNEEKNNMSEKFYRTKDGKADYKFSFEQQRDGDYRAYVESSPSYGSRASDIHSTHRLNDGGRKYVCWTEDLHSEDEAKTVAAKWADATQDYIKTGKKF